MSVYSASKSGFSGFTESLRRELADTPVGALHVVTGGVETDMMDAVRGDLGEHFDTSGWDQYTPEEQADRIAGAIASDDETLGPGGKAALGKLATHLPSFVLDSLAGAAFDRGRS